MTQHYFSRRRLLCCLLPGLAAWLCPRSHRAAATPISESANIHQPSTHYFYTAYSYDVPQTPSPSIPTMARTVCAAFKRKGKMEVEKQQKGE